MKRSLPRTWNDWLALLLLVGIGAMWVLAELNETVLGATIMIATLVTQFYFRRSPPEGE